MNRAEFDLISNAIKLLAGAENYIFIVQDEKQGAYMATSLTADNVTLVMEGVLDAHRSGKRTPLNDSAEKEDGVN